MGFSRRYMKSAEFKARQLWLDFKDAIGTALEAVEPVKEKAWAWFEAWRKAFRIPEPKPEKPLQPQLDGFAIP